MMSRMRALLPLGLVLLATLWFGKQAAAQQSTLLVTSYIPIVMLQAAQPGETPHNDDHALLVPVRIEGEDYRTGGAGIAYADMTPGNSGGAYRSDDVDIQLPADETGGYRVTGIQAGEWLTYDISVARDDRYVLLARVASAGDTGRFSVQLDGTRLAESLAVPNTQESTNWTIVETKAVSLSAGSHVVRFDAEAGEFELDYLELVAVSAAYREYPAPRPSAPIPGEEAPLVVEPSVDDELSAMASSTSYPIQLVWFWKPPTDGNLDKLATNFTRYLLTANDERTREQLKSRGEKGPFMQYMMAFAIHNPGSCSATPYKNQVAWKAGDFCWLSSQHPEWFLRDKYGNRLHYGDWYYMDPGGSGYRWWWLSRVKELHEIRAWDGVVLDNLDGSLSRLTRRGLYPARYADNASWRSAVEGFLSYISSNYFKPKGRPLYANITESDAWTVWDRYLTYLDGAMEEGWAVDWSSGYLSSTSWENHLRIAENVLARGKYMMMVSQGYQSDYARQKFAFASYLLVARSKASFRYARAAKYGEGWWYSNYASKLGAYKGARYREGDYWRRNFERGYVKVNPVTRSVTIVTW